jgi:hypothetical protein
MEIKDLLTLRKISFGILTLTVGLVLSFGVVVVAGIASSNPYDANEVFAGASPKNETAPLASSAQDRVPASIVAAAVGTGATTVDFKCLEKKAQQSLETQSAQMRIRAHLCSDAFDIVKTEIVNTSNGYTAAVFKTADRIMSSDYIQLSDGVNRIKIQLQDRHGLQQTSELLVLRNPAP